MTNHSIILIDNTKNISQTLELDVEKHNQPYPSILLKADPWFGFPKTDMEIPAMLNKLKGGKDE